MNKFIFIVYDGITNSIFDSQVLQPLIERKKRDPSKPIILITFERKQPDTTYKTLLEKKYGITLVVLKKYPFLGLWSLNPAIRQLKKILKHYASYELFARGAHAGFIALRALNKANCLSITVQARGLLEQEYAYTHRFAKQPYALLHTWRMGHFHALEKYVYSYVPQNIPFYVEAVSQALKEYLIQTYETKPELITIAQHDIPQKIDAKTVQTWRTAIRTQLGIADTTYVYCYNGSAKPWQCPQESIDFFVQRIQENPQTFLLILSQDKKVFEQLLHDKNIDPSHYYVCSVPHEKVFEYLAACDAGLLFRENSLINWVSRPTKALEYQATGLPIIHNNTVAWLNEITYNNNPAIIAESKLDSELPSTASNPSSHSH
ncbi:MAG: hypothetical protein AB7R69_05860 [Candidatus Babeliales bacterium]